MLPECSDGDVLFLRLSPVCFGNGWKSSFKNRLVRT